MLIMEVNVFRKNISRVSARVAYVYPSLYKAMISSLAPDIVYSMLNSIEEVYVERFSCSRLYGPEDPPKSLETGSPLRDFKLILTSLHYEPDIVNLARILLASGIGVLSKGREKHVVVAGGPVCIENPVPFSDIIDVCVVGEAEVTLPEIVNLWLQYGDSKKSFLEAVSQLRYTYVSMYEDKRVEKKYVPDLDSAFYPIRQVENLLVEPVYGRGFKLEVSRGCPYWCSFCIETRAFQPYRERSYTKLVRIVEEGVAHSVSGKRLVLYSLAFPVSSNNLKLLEYLAHEGFKASLPSIRLTPLLLKALDTIKQLGQRSLTIAPESFSSIIQRSIFKYPGVLGYVLDLIEELLRKGFNLKLYIVYGFKGLESSNVISENVTVMNNLLKLAKSLGRRVSITLNPLVPKPRTIFQYIGMMSREELMSILREYRSKLGSHVDYRAYDVDWAIVQAQLSLFKEPLGEFIVKWAQHGGGLAGWRRAVRELDVNFKYVFTGYNIDEELPWDRIHLGDRVDEVLRAQYEVYKKLST
ncbi:MAG: radical SAM protein [Desulfurococcaceae archaeon]